MSERPEHPFQDPRHDGTASTACGTTEDTEWCLASTTTCLRTCPASKQHALVHDAMSEGPYKHPALLQPIPACPPPLLAHRAIKCNVQLCQADQLAQ